MIRWIAPLLVASSLTCAGKALAEAPSRESLARADAWVARQLSEHELLGGALVVTYEDRVVLVRTYGVADRLTGRAVQLDTPFVSASIAKSFTAVAILQLRDRGLLELDAPVQRYLPWFRVLDEPASRKITIRHLLNHTSGLPENAHAVVWQNPSIRDSLENGVRALAAIRLRNSPGASFVYSNMNYATLGLIVERVSGERWEHYLSREIFEPLAMTGSSAERSRAEALGVARGYGPEFGRLVEQSLSAGAFLAPAAEVYLTAPDLGRWLTAHLGVSRPSILRQSSLDEAHYGGTVDGASRYAMGWGTSSVDGRVLISHSGASSHSMFMVLDPAHSLGVGVMTNAFTGVIGDIGRGALAIVDGRTAQPVGRDPYLWGSRALVAVTTLSWLSLAVMARAALRRGQRTMASLLRTRLRAIVASLVAITSTLIVLVVVPARAPALPAAFGIRGWPVDLVLAGVSMLLASWTWAGRSARDAWQRPRSTR